MAERERDARSLFLSVTGETSVTERQQEDGGTGSRLVDDEPQTEFQAEDGLDDTYPAIDVEHD